MNGRPVLGLIIRSDNEHRTTRTVELLEEGHPVRVSSWSIESDWLYVVFTGQRRAFRLYPEDYEIEEVLGAPAPSRSRIVT